MIFIQKWNEQDISILKNNYKNVDVKTICDLLDNKFSYRSVISKANKLKIKSREFWTTDELTILKTYYPLKTPDEMLPLLPNRNKKTITMKACDLGIKNIISDVLWYKPEDIEFIKNNWESMTDEEMGKVLGRKNHAISDKRCELGLSRQNGESSYNNLSEFVRRNNLDWKKESMMNCRYRCVITNERFDDIHHTHGVNLILNEVLLQLNIQIKDKIDDYSDKELSSILFVFRELQNKYPLGVCLKKEIHNEFHMIYGYGDNTIEQWHEFLEKYNNITEHFDYKRDGDESRKN